MCAILTHSSNTKMSNSSIFYQKDGKTNIAYNCLDRHLEKKDFDVQEDALLWDGNYWDGDVHDVSEISWESIGIVTNKAANIFRSYCEKGDSVLLFLPNVVQLPISILAAARIGVEAVIVSAVDCSAEMLADILEMTTPKLIVTVDAFFQGTELIESKKILDQAIETQNPSSAPTVLVIRHCAPNDGVPPPEVMLPARRPCYAISFSLNPPRDVEWSQLFRTASADNSEIQWMHPHETCVVLPIRSPNLYLRSISIKELLDATGKISAELTESTGPILSLPVPHSLFSLAAMMSPWFNGKCLASYEGPLGYPDPSRLNHVIAKFEIQAVLLEDSTSLDDEYLGFVPVPSLKTLLISERVDRNKLELAYPGTNIVNMKL